MEGLHFTQSDKLHELAEVLAMKLLISVSKYLSMNNINTVCGFPPVDGLCCYHTHPTR